MAELRLAPGDGAGVKFAAPSDTLPEASAERKVPLEWPFTVQPGDCFEIDLPALGAPLVNPLQTVSADFTLGGVRPL